MPMHVPAQALQQEEAVGLLQLEAQLPLASAGPKNMASGKDVKVPVACAYS
jgi:hypothetical protein